MNDNLLLTTPAHVRADKIKNRALLLDTARRLFAEQGVEAVTMSDIATSANVGKGTLYRHFTNKTELCHALLDHDMRELQQRALARLQQQGDARDDLSWFLQEVALFVSRNEPLLCVEAGNLSLEHPAHFWWRQTMLGLLRRISPSGDVTYLADVLYVMVDVRTIRFQRQRLGYDLDRILAGLQSTVDALTF